MYSLHMTTFLGILLTINNVKHALNAFLTVFMVTYILYIFLNHGIFLQSFNFNIRVKHVLYSEAFSHSRHHMKDLFFQKNSKLLK